MPIAVTCPECNANYRVADEAAGKAIKCKKCGARVPVPAASAPAGAADAEDDFAGITSKPASKASRNDDEGDEGEAAASGPGSKAKKKGGSNKVLYIVLASVLGFCCICTGVGGGVGYWLYDTGKTAVNKAKADIEAMQKGQAKEMFKDAFKDMPKGGNPVIASGPTLLDKNETLTMKDPPFNGKPAKSYKVKLEAEKVYVIDMKAAAKALLTNDPYLIVTDSKGQIVSQNDDVAPGDFDSQIVYRAATTGEYTVHATFTGQLPTGSMPFHLTVKQK